MHLQEKEKKPLVLSVDVKMLVRPEACWRWARRCPYSLRLSNSWALKIPKRMHSILWVHQNDHLVEYYSCICVCVLFWRERRREEERESRVHRKRRQSEILHRIFKIKSRWIRRGCRPAYVNCFYLLFLRRRNERERTTWTVDCTRDRRLLLLVEHCRVWYVCLLYTSDAADEV